MYIELRNGVSIGTATRKEDMQKFYLNRAPTPRAVKKGAADFARVILWARDRVVATFTFLPSDLGSNTTTVESSGR